MAVEVEGEGAPVILLHGLGGTSNLFTPQLGALRGRRVIRPDLPGSGRSPFSGRLSIEGFAEAVVRLARVLGVERADFAGHSLGTLVCQQIALLQPWLVRSLALFGPLSEPPEPARAALRARAAKARAEGLAEIADAIVQGATSSETKERRPLAAALVRELVMRQPPEGYAATCEALAEARAADLTRIACPVLLMTGDEDAVAPASMMRAMAERLERARAETLSRCGHWTTLEKAEDVGRAFRDFLATRR